LGIRRNKQDKQKRGCSSLILIVIFALSACSGEPTRDLTGTIQVTPKKVLKGGDTLYLNIFEKVDYATELNQTGDTLVLFVTSYENYIKGIK
jgi:hypothetical protein